MNITKIVLSFILVLSTVSCVSTTTIKALDKNGKVDKDVKIYVAGELIGNGKAIYSDKSSTSSAVPFLELKKEGCKNYREKLDTQARGESLAISTLMYLTGLSIMLMPEKLGLKPSLQTTYWGGIISLVGSIPLYWSKTYVPVQSQEFQCVKIANK